MAGPTGLEPATSSVTGKRSSQLSYGPTPFPHPKGAGKLRNPISIGWQRQYGEPFSRASPILAFFINYSIITTHMRVTSPRHRSRPDALWIDLAGDDILIGRQSTTLLTLQGEAAQRLYSTFCKAKATSPDKSVNCHGLAQHVLLAHALGWAKVSPEVKDALILDERFLLGHALKELELPCGLTMNNDRLVEHSAILLGKTTAGGVLLAQKAGEHPMELTTFADLVRQYDERNMRMGFYGTKKENAAGAA